MITSILTNSVPAAPQMIVGTVGELAQDARFGFLSSSLTSNLPRWFGGLFLSTKNRSTSNQISRVAIFPGSVTIRKGEDLVLSAVGYNSQNVPLSGIDFKWRMTDSEHRFPPRKLQGGKFKASITGTFTVSAKGGGREAEITVVVLPSVAPSATPQQNRVGQSESEPRQISSRSSKSGKQNKTENSAESEAISQNGETDSPETPRWNEENWESSDDPGNQPGNPPGMPADDGAGSGNFQLSAPVISLPGRGIDVALNLNYNSRLWNKSFTQSSSTQLTYDIDRGFPSPGWSLGFGKIVDLGATGGSMIVDADGTRHGFSGTITPGGHSFYGQTSDGTFIDYESHRSAQFGVYSATAKMPNGTTINYGARGYGAIYPSLIQDANGNFISITYRNNIGPEIETVTDTMGRVIQFNYDTNGRLITVTAPQMTVQEPGGGGLAGVRTLVRFHYRQLTLNYSFASGVGAAVADNAPWVLDSIYYPATQTGYWFGGADSSHPDYSSYYSSYGMLTKVVEQRGMSWQAGATAQGTIIAGQMTKQAVYNYPLTTANESGRTSGSNLSDAPTYDKLTESWAGMDVAEPAVTTYDVQQNASPRVTTVTQPNGAVSRQYAYNHTSLPDSHPDKFKDGLVYQDETYVPDANGTAVPNLTGTYKLVGKSTVVWEMGQYQSPRPNNTEVFDENNQKIRTEFVYASGQFNQVTHSCDYDNNQVKLRCTVNQYENSPVYTTQYPSRHIFNLVKATGIENPDGTLASWTEYEYDNYQSQPFTAAPGVIQHDYTHDSFTTETRDGENCLRLGPLYQCGTPPETSMCRDCLEYEQVSAYNPNTAARGNITKVTSYADAQNRTGAISETRSYDVTGNLVKTSTACCQQTSFQYTVGTQYAYPESQTRGAADPNSPDRITTQTAYSYETGLATQTVDANGRTSSMEYNADTLRPIRTTSPTGAYSFYSYDDQAMTVTEEVREATGNIGGKNRQAAERRGANPARRIARRERRLGLRRDEIQQSRTSLETIASV